MRIDEIPVFRPLTGICEPSAIHPSPDGRFLVLEDKKERPLSLVTLGADGELKTEALTAGLPQMFSSFWKLDDLEGLAADRVTVAGLRGFEKAEGVSPAFVDGLQRIIIVSDDGAAAVNAYLTAKATPAAQRTPEQAALMNPALAGVKVGEEFATSSVSSPGLESHLALPTPQVKAIFEGVVDDLMWIDPSRRGYLKMSFTATEAKGEWVFVDTITNRSYQASVGRTASYTG